jgi:hypothetical protein
MDLKLTAAYIGKYASRVKTWYKTITDKLLGKACGIKTAKDWHVKPLTLFITPKSHHKTI